MKVLMLNGSANEKGCTYTALTEVGKALEKNGVSYEIYQLGKKAVRDCIACGKCEGKGCIFTDDGVHEFIEKAKEADGFVFGSPVYYAHPSGRVLSFLDRVFYSTSKKYFIGKPGAAVVSARRAGTTASMDVLNKYFSISAMPIVSSTYWNMVHGNTPQEVSQDLEGLQIMRNLGTSMAWMIKAFHTAKENGVELPRLENACRTNFIR